MFVKYASVSTLGVASVDDNGELRRVASAASNGDDSSPRLSSYYVDGARKLDVPAMLKLASSIYEISDNPHDYFFEAIRANTVNVPNENHDAFHKNELLRFDTKYRSPFGDKTGMPVYMTYSGKGHFVDHKAEIKNRARGVILDAHYNDFAAPLSKCAAFGHDTSEPSQRDASGIHCSKCASVVKDEFVEILVAVDTKKDPKLAEGIRKGALNAGSMGCQCNATICNVCDHVAHSVKDFCEHIKGSAKGSLWRRKGSKFIRTSADEVRFALGRSNYLLPLSQTQKTVHSALVIPENDFEVRRAFEFCIGVEFDEYSRVHKPADPKALTVEILKAAADEASKLASSSGRILSIEEETENLIKRAQRAKLEASFMTKAASTGAKPQTFYAVRVNGNDEDLHVAKSLTDAVKTAALGNRDIAEYFTVEASTEKQALVRAASLSAQKIAQYLPMTADVSLVVPDGMQVVVDQQGNQVLQPGDDMSGPGDQMPGAVPGGAPGMTNEVQAPSVEDVTQDEQSPEEFGMLPPGASAESDAHGIATQAEGTDERMNEMTMEPGRLASLYGSAQVDIDPSTKTAIISGPQGELFSVSASKAKTLTDLENFGLEVLASLDADGIVRTAKKYDATFASRVADATEGAIFDMVDSRPSANSALEGAEFDMTEQREKFPLTSVGDSLRGMMSDMADKREKMPANSIESRETDLAEEASTSSPKDTATDDHEEDLESGERKNYSPSDSALDGAKRDFKASLAKKEDALKAQFKTASDRTRKLHASQVEQLRSEHAAELAAVKTALVDQFTRALKMASKRRELNVEESPLKAKFYDVLTVARPVGVSASTGHELKYAGVSDGLALHLAEAAYQNAAEDEIESLIKSACDLLSYDDGYLVSVEKDLARQASFIPQLTAEAQLGLDEEMHERAASKRAALSKGNLMLTPAPADVVSGQERGKLALREALASTTRLGRQMNESYDA